MFGLQSNLYCELHSKKKNPGLSGVFLCLTFVTVWFFIQRHFNADFFIHITERIRKHHESGTASRRD